MAWCDCCSCMYSAHTNSQTTLRWTEVIYFQTVLSTLINRWNEKWWAITDTPPVTIRISSLSVFQSFFFWLLQNPDMRCVRMLVVGGWHIPGNTRRWRWQIQSNILISFHQRFVIKILFFFYEIPSRTFRTDKPYVAHHHLSCAHQFGWFAFGRHTATDSSVGQTQIHDNRCMRSHIYSMMHLLLFIYWNLS